MPPAQPCAAICLRRYLRKPCTALQQSDILTRCVSPVPPAQPCAAICLRRYLRKPCTASQQSDILCMALRHFFRLELLSAWSLALLSA